MAASPVSSSSVRATDEAQAGPTRPAGLAPSLRRLLFHSTARPRMNAPTKPTFHEPKPYVWTGPPLSEARSLDRNCYVSPDFFRAEIEHVHARGWILVGRV